MVFNSINNLHNNNISTELTNPIDKFHKFKTTATDNNNTSITKLHFTNNNNNIMNSSGGGLCINSNSNSVCLDVNKMSNSTSSSHRLGQGLSIGSLCSSTATGKSSSSSSSTSSSSGGSSKKQLSTEDKKINLNALKNQDPFATNIVDTAFRVAVYKFVSKKNEWVRNLNLDLFY